MPLKSENSVLKSIIRKGLGFKFPSSVIKQCNEAFLVERTYEAKVRHCINCREGMEQVKLADIAPATGGADGQKRW